MIDALQDLTASLPAVLQWVGVLLAAAIPFVESYFASVIGVLAGINPVIAVAAAVVGNVVSMLVFVLSAHNLRSKVVSGKEPRELDFEAQMPVLEAAIKDAAAKQADLEGYLAALGGRKREMEADLAAFLAGRQALDTDSSAGSMGVVGAVERRADRAQSAFDRALNGTGAPGSATSDRETLAKLGELEKVVRRNSIAERLAAVKAAG